MKRRTFINFLLSAMLLLEGCVMVPVPTFNDKVLTGKPVTDEQLSFLAPNVTTMDDVIAGLGNPDIIWEDARVFVYIWDMRQGILFWATGAYYTGAAGMKDIAKHYLLLIQFDEQHKVLRYDRATRPLSQPCADFLTEWLQNSPASLPADRRNRTE
jgi:hypothetical protein